MRQRGRPAAPLDEAGQVLVAFEADLHRPPLRRDDQSEPHRLVTLVAHGVNTQRPGRNQNGSCRFSSRAFCVPPRLWVERLSTGTWGPGLSSRSGGQGVVVLVVVLSPSAGPPVRRQGPSPSKGTGARAFDVREGTVGLWAGWPLCVPGTSSCGFASAPPPAIVPLGFAGIVEVPGPLLPDVMRRSRRLQKGARYVYQSEGRQNLPVGSRRGGGDEDEMACDPRDSDPGLVECWAPSA
jgi:hypothetical protein